MFDRATIVGVGLIGGSLGMALRARGVAREVVGVPAAAASTRSARAARAIDRGTVDPAAGVAGADLVVLAVPPDQVVPMARRVAPHLQPGALLTDVASVKAEIVESIEALLRPESGPAFVGGHPMAGNERQGVAAASPDLFEGTAYLMTPTPRTPRGSVERLAGLARALGAIPLEVEPAEHDRMVALVSHLPYLVAAALIGTGQGIEGIQWPRRLSWNPGLRNSIAGRARGTSCPSPARWSRISKPRSRPICACAISPGPSCSKASRAERRWRATRFWARSRA